jgi:hypothetical protein
MTLNFSFGKKMSRNASFFIIFSAIILVAVGGNLLYSSAAAEVAASIIVSPTEGLVTDENGGSDSFSITLDSEPASPVKITLVSTDATEGIVSTSTVTLNKNNYVAKVVNVIGLPDGIQDGDVSYQITGTASSKDSAFDGLAMPAVSVTNLNDPIPVANDDSASTTVDTSVEVDVLENDDALDDIPLILNLGDSPSSGDFKVNPDNTITYTPDLGFTGDDQFTYQICDADGDCASATVFITVVPGSVLVAVDDKYSVGQDNSLDVEPPGVLVNDIDPQNNDLQAVKLSDPSNGNLSFYIEGDFTYTPDPGFIGSDSFTYAAINGTDQSPPATVIIEVLDQIPPTVEWVAPTTSGEIYNLYEAEVYLEVEASDNYQLNCIEFIHWDAEKTEFIHLGTDCEAKYGFTIDSSVLNIGWNQIFVQADDQAGNLSEFKHIWLYRLASIFLPIVGR